MMLGASTVNFMRSNRYMQIHQGKASKALLRLSTGKRINSAADDAAGLAITQRMRSQMTGASQQIRNLTAESAMLNTADGAMSETQSVLQRMKELAAQAASGNYTDEERKLMDIEYQGLMECIDDIYSSTQYNGIKVLNDGDIAMKTAAELVPGEVGLKTDAPVTNIGSTDNGQRLPFKSNTASMDNIKGDGSEPEKTIRETNLLTQDAAKEAMKLVDGAIRAVSYSRAGVGANINVLDHQISYLEEAAIQAAASLSEIEDADMAQEMMNYTKASILMQVAQAMMAHTMDDSKVVVNMLMSM